MPRRRKSYRRPYKKRYAKKKKHRTLPIGGFPKSKMVKFRYVAEVNINAPLAGIASHVFSANGLYDPDLTGVGHQPGNFDKWMTVYDHYQVLGSKITVTPILDSTSGVSPTAYIGILKADSTPKASTMSVTEILEQKMGRFSRVPVGALNWGSVKRRSVVNTYSASKFFGKTKAVTLGDDTQKGNVSNNPAEQCYYEVWCGSVNGNDPLTHSFLVEVEYITILSEPKITEAS